MCSVGYRMFRDKKSWETLPQGNEGNRKQQPQLALCGALAVEL